VEKTYEVGLDLESGQSHFYEEDLELYSDLNEVKEEVYNLLDLKR